MSVPKKNKKVVEKQIPNQKTSKLVRFWNKTFTMCQIWNQSFYNASDFKTWISSVGF